MENEYRYDGQADLRLLYQVYSSQIEFSKTHLWSVLNYSMWAIAGIVGLYKGYKSFVTAEHWLFLFPCMIIFVLFLCVYNMLMSWFSMRKCRKEYVEISEELSETFRIALKRARGDGRTFPCNYGSLQYDRLFVLPLIFVIVMGSLLAYIYVVSDIGVCGFGQFFGEFRWLFRSSFGCFCLLLYFFIVHDKFVVPTVRKWYKKWQEKKKDKSDG